MKRIILSLSLFLSFLVLGLNSVYASTWTNVDIQTLINDDGSMNVTYTFDVNGTDGTEWYYEFYDSDVTYTDFCI